MAPTLTLRENEVPEKEVVSSVFMWEKSWEVSERRLVNPVGMSTMASWKGLDRTDGHTRAAEEGLLPPNLWPFKPLSSSPDLQSDVKMRASMKGKELHVFVLPKYNQMDLKMALSYETPSLRQTWEITSRKQCLVSKSLLVTFWSCCKGRNMLDRTDYLESKKIRAGTIPYLSK